MSKQRIDIPILGMDRRLSERQSVPGICEQVENLTPSGHTDRPYWKREPLAGNLTNNSGESFTLSDGTSLIRAGWHVRNTVGKYGQAAGSLKRLVGLFSDGTIRLIDPEPNWSTVATLDLGVSGSDDMDCSFARMNNLLAVAVTVNGRDHGLYYIVDDLILEFDYPDLPLIIEYYAGHEFYSAESLNNDLYEGMRNGSIYVAYGFRSYDGSVVKMSMPRQMWIPHHLDSTNELTYKLKFVHDGYRQLQTPANLEFWEDQIESVVILAGGYKPPYENNLPKVVEEDDLENLMLYEIGSFPFLDASGKSPEERVIEVLVKPDELSGYPLAEISAIQTKITGEVISSYNSRLMIGASSEDYPMPALPSFHTAFNRVLFTNATSGVVLRVDVYGAPVSLDMVTLDSGLSAAAVEAHNANGPVYNRITATIDAGTYQMTLDFGYYTVTITQNEVSSSQPVPISSYAMSTALTNIRLAVEIEAADGVYTRVLEQDLPARLNQGVNTNYLNLSGGLFSYPDRRAKKLYVYENNAGYVLQSVVNLRSSKTQNFSFCALGFAANGSEHTKELPANSVNQQKSYFPNRVYASQTNNPFTFLAAQVNYVGSGGGERVRAFASNTLAISSGQFGQYPLYILCEHSVWALEQSQDPLIAFARKSPVSLSHGVRSERQVASLGQGVMFIYGDSVFALYGGDVQEVGQPISNYPGRPQIDFSIAELSSRNRDGHDELLLSDGNKVYVFSTKYRRWYSFEQQVNTWFKEGNNLYSLQGEHNIIDYQRLLGDSRAFRVVYNPVHFNLPEIMKRLYSLAFRGQANNVTINITPSESGVEHSSSNGVLHLRDRSSFDFLIVLQGQMSSSQEYLEGVTAVVEARYTHKNRVYV